MLCPILLSERSESKNPLLEIVAERVGNLAAVLQGWINLGAHRASTVSFLPFRFVL
jgi:hypothetical protein